MQIPESIIKKESRKKKPYIWLILYILLFILSATSSYLQYASSAKMEAQYHEAVQTAYNTIDEKDIQIAILGSMIETIIEAYDECCEPKTAI